MSKRVDSGRQVPCLILTSNEGCGLDDRFLVYISKISRCCPNVARCSPRWSDRSDRSIFTGGGNRDPVGSAREPLFPRTHLDDTIQSGERDPMTAMFQLFEECSTLHRSLLSAESFQHVVERPGRDPVPGGGRLWHGLLPGQALEGTGSGEGWEGNERRVRRITTPPVRRAQMSTGKATNRSRPPSPSPK